MSDDMATTIERDTAQRSARPSPVSPDEPAAPAKPGGRRTAFIIMGVVLIGLAAVGARRWVYSLSHVSTDNAQVDGHIVPILPKVGGYVLDVRTDENRPAKAGDTLVVLDDRDYKARLAQAEADLAVALAGVSNRVRVGQAEAQVAQAQANAEKAHADLERIKPLAEKDIVPKQALDAAEAAARAADAALAAAQAALLGADARVGAPRAARRGRGIPEAWGAAPCGARGGGRDARRGGATAGGGAGRGPPADTRARGPPAPAGGGRHPPGGAGSARGSAARPW